MLRPTFLLFLLGLTPLAAAPARAQWSIDALSQARTNVAVATVGHFVIFAGGNDGPQIYDLVDVYDGATDTWSTATLSVPRAGCAATVVGDLVFFAGGAPAQGAFSNVVDIYDASIDVPSNPAAWSTWTLSRARAGAGATTVGLKAFFAGGQQVQGSTDDRVDIYDASIGVPSNPAAWSTATLSRARAFPSAVSVGDLAIFAGGWLAPGGVPVADVDIYDESTGLWSTAALSEARILGLDAGVAVGTRAYFGGGHVSAFGGPDMSNVVDVYDAATGLWSSETLSVARGYLGATAVGNTVLFAGGRETGHVPSDVVDTFNVGTGQWDATHRLSQARSGLSAATLGGKALLAGGFASGAASSIVDVYEPVGVSYCAATPNSTGEAATISAAGSSSLAANDLVLRAADLPSGKNYLFFHGSVQKQVPFRNGYLCTGGGLVRLGPPGSATGGLAQQAIDLPSAKITTPGVRYFQCWYRDPSGGGALVNTSDAIAITFVP